MADLSNDQPHTAGAEYAERLRRLQGARWKQVLDVQAPYRHNLQRMTLGRTIDVGCGIGRNLAYLSPDSLGVDHNATSVGFARERGLNAITVDEYAADPDRYAGGFDALLAAHLIEHMPYDVALSILRSYLPALRPHARLVFICPQERGYRSDATHVAFADFAVLRRLARELGATPELQYSFPFPRSAGRLFIYNEFVVVSRMP
ncbi:class I SAM-dependent methyltransferase [Microbacterium sp. NPDC058389]|uniref:class I SAM-dependent methyltransferase n=1 Tax=Microbacterium sp. NPDC058389 TaxID=3346475 RepID=UPI00365CFEDD